MIFILIAALVTSIPLHNSNCKKNCENKVVEMFWADGTITKQKIRVCY